MEGEQKKLMEDQLQEAERCSHLRGFLDEQHICLGDRHVCQPTLARWGGGWRGVSFNKGRVDSQVSGAPSLLETLTLQ